ncbi:hypothetical protein C2845_PM18G06400 [Panicum miliaceum]|uniref:Uncharacterized protein n=1 Tax=Panicum miliaceum TaxID=4540 RepID=A0A3L6PG62_PANMI|nr:hypothetical protein C2845_PM18G06400 [Panicum miliaceum]
MIGSSTDIKRGCDEDPTFDMDVDGNLELEIVGQDEPDARLDLNMQGQVPLLPISNWVSRSNFCDHRGQEKGFWSVIFAGSCERNFSIS